MNKVKVLILIAFFICVLPMVFGKSPRELFTFIQLTDTQMGFISENKNSDEEIRLYSEAVGLINKIKPEFVVITGDLIHSRTDTSQINAFKKITSLISKKISVYILPGNHDIERKPTKESIEFYFSNYDYDKFSFKYKNVQFIGINSCYINSRIEQEVSQYNWLKQNLSENPTSTRKIVFTHHPFYIDDISETDSYSNIAQPNRSEYLELFKKSGVVSVFAGHHHKNAESFYKGMDLVTTSAVGKQLGSVKSGFRVVKVYQDSITHEYVEF